MSSAPEHDWEAEYHKLAREFVEKQGEMQGQMNQLRKENAELRKRLDEAPSLLTELQDRVTLLEAFPPRH